MAGLYVHIPFCKSRCIYCGFYSTTLLALCDHYVAAVCREWDMRRASLKDSVHTIYIGGGTPTVLSADQLSRLMAHLGGTANEVTVECNPDDIDDAWAAAMRSCGVNRVSLGAQTFNDQRLRFLRRRHTASQIAQAVASLRTAGFDNISIDLMYGFPGETIADWQYDLDVATGLGVEHVSAYALTYEEGTTLYRMLQEGRVEEIDEELSRQMYYMLCERMKSEGYEHYEISNFAQPGRSSLHNSGYWNQTPYIGLGAAAHSFDGTCRQWNIADVKSYIESVEQGQPLTESETLDPHTRYNDIVMTALRTCEGLRIDSLDREHRDYCLSNARRYIEGGQLVIVGDVLRLSESGIFVSDMVMADLMWV